MESLRAVQRRFVAAVLGTADDILPLVPGDHGAADVRFSVHRNNVLTSLSAALEATFPVTRALVGEAFFAAMAARFVTTHPPRLAWLSSYGEALPQFIADFRPAAELVYLADVARLEWLRSRAAQAPAAPVLDLVGLGDFRPSDLGELRLALHPAAFLLRSDFPVLDIWAAHQEGADPDREVRLDAGGVCVLVSRPLRQVLVQVLTPGERILLSTIDAGCSLGEAVWAAAAADPEFDLATSLARAVSAGAFGSHTVGNRHLQRRPSYRT